jgi:N-methylhydantoinase A
VTNTIVAGAIANAAHRRGHDVRDFTLLMGGGLGPAHAADIALELRIPYVVAPKGASTYCAFGMLLSDLRHNFVHSYYTTTAAADLDRINGLFREMEGRGMTTLKEEGVAPENMEFLRSLDMRYRGQFYEIEVPVSDGQFTQASVEDVVERFHLLHQELYAFSVEDKPTEMMNYKLVAVGRIEKPPLKPLESDGADPSRALGPSRPVYFSEVKDFVETQIYDGNGIRAGDRIAGPAIIEEPFTTITVPPDFKCEVDPYGNYVMEVPL